MAKYLSVSERPCEIYSLVFAHLWPRTSASTAIVNRVIHHAQSKPQPEKRLCDKPFTEGGGGGGKKAGKKKLGFAPSPSPRKGAVVTRRGEMRGSLTHCIDKWNRALPRAVMVVWTWRTHRRAAGGRM